MRSNKLEYSTATGLYCTTYGVKVNFCMPLFSTSKIINHRFHVDNYKVESGIGYGMIIRCDLTVELFLTSNSKRQVLKWDGATIPMK